MSVYFTGESSFDARIEADSNDITEYLHDDKPRPYLCTVCDERFISEDSLNNHKLKHAGEKLYYCTQCEKGFPNKCTLNFHTGKWHKGKYKCDECGKGFQNPQVLTAHRRSHSDDKPRPGVSAVCSEQFASEDSLNDHAGEKLHSCTQCEKTFPNQYSLNFHTRKLHKGKYKCDECGRSFRSPLMLTTHRQTHSDGKPRPSVSAVCNEQFASEDSLNDNKLKHTPEKLHSCTQCENCLLYTSDAADE